MRLLLDTTYLLPAVGLGVEGLPGDLVVRLIGRGHEVVISYITVFELAAKGAKYVAQGKLTVERVLKGLKAVLHDDRIERVLAHEQEVLFTAVNLRRLLPDFVNCLILATALHKADVLVTEDEELHEISETSEFRALAATVNPRFKVKRARDLP